MTTKMTNAAQRAHHRDKIHDGTKERNTSKETKDQLGTDLRCSAMECIKSRAWKKAMAAAVCVFSRLAFNRKCGGRKAAAHRKNTMIVAEPWSGATNKVLSIGASPLRRDDESRQTVYKSMKQISKARHPSSGI